MAGTGCGTAKGRLVPLVVPLVAMASPCLPRIHADAARVTIIGQFTYTAKVFGQTYTLPIRAAKAELWEKRTGLEQAVDEKLGTGATNAQGVVTFTVDTPIHRWGGDDKIDVAISVWPDNAACDVDDYYGLQVVPWQSYELKSNQKNDVTSNVTLTGGASGLHGLAFYIADVLLAARPQWRNLTGGWTRGVVKVDWWHDTNGYNQAQDKILLARQGANNDEMSAENPFHEYGHAIHKARVGSIPSYSSSDEQAGTTGAAPRDDIALCEGWAEFVSLLLQVMVKNDDPVLRGHLGFIPATEIGSVESFASRPGIDNARHIPTVQAILWDLYDAAATGGETDAVANFAEIWRIPGTNPSSIKDFYSRWNQPDKEAVKQVFTAHGITVQ